MAATDIQYGGLDPVLYTPDFSFLRYVLDKKNNQYEEGLKSASASYNNLKKELSDPTNTQKRDEYLKAAQGQLQKIASSDLSLQQNVNFANSIFEPLATDRAFAYDSYYTAKNKKELAEMDGWANSDDMEVRKKFNPEIQAWLKRDLDSIKNGNGDIKNYKAQGRSAFAAVDAQDILAEAAKDHNFKYKVDNLGQPYIVTADGGTDGVPNYHEFAENVLANNAVYQQQNNILGENRQESVLEKYRTDPKLAPQWVNATPKEIYKDYAEKTFAEHRDAEQSYIDTKTANFQKADADINAYVNANKEKLDQGYIDASSGIDSPDAQMYISTQQKIASRNSLNTQLQDVKENFATNYGDGAKFAENIAKYTDNFLKNPKSFFSDQQFKNDVTTFSNIKASSFTRTIKEDRAYVDITVAKTNALKVLNDAKDDVADNLTDQQKIDLKEQELRLKGLKTVKNADGTTSQVPIEADIKPIDVDATQINIINSLNKLTDQVTASSYAAKENMMGTSGGLSMLENMGMASEDVGKVKALYSKYWDNEKNATMPMTDADRKLLSTAYGYMSAFAQNNPKSDFKAVSTLRIQDVPDLLDHAMKGYKCKTEAEVAIKNQMAEYHTNTAQINLAATALAVGKAAVIKANEKNPAYAGMFVNRGTADKPNMDIINEKDISKMFSPYIKDKNILDQIGKQFINGTLNYQENHSTGKGKNQNWLKRSLAYIPEGTSNVPTESTIIEINGQYYQMPGKPSPLSPKQYKSLSKKINDQHLVPNFGEAAGLAKASPFYKLNGAVKQDAIDTLGNVTLTNANVMEFTSGTSEGTQLKAAEQDLVRNAIKSKDAIADVVLLTSSPTNAGGQSVKVTFSVDLKSGADKNPLAGRSFFFPITPTEASRPIFQIFNKVNEVSEFEPLRTKGLTYKMDNFEAEGIRARIIPNTAGSRVGTIVVEQRAYDPKTKTYSDVWQKVGEGEKPLEYNLDSQTFPEIKQFVTDRFITPYVTGTINYEKQRKASLPSGTAGKNGTDILLSKRN